MLGRATRGLRRPGGLDERDRPRARARRLLRDRRRLDRRRRSAPPCRPSARAASRVAFFGDGATNQGYFHECLNMAAVSALPLVFVCENNFYAEFTPLAAATAGADIAGRARGLRRSRRRSSTATTCGRCTPRPPRRSSAPGRGGGPTLLECQTYRHYGHSKSDPGAYRPKGELERWLERDPLTLARARLLADGVCRGRDRRRPRSGSPPRWRRRSATRRAAPYPDPVTDAGARSSRS